VDSFRPFPHGLAADLNILKEKMSPDPANAALHGGYGLIKRHPRTHAGVSRVEGAERI
jgi:hypothetical protein